MQFARRATLANEEQATIDELWLDQSDDGKEAVHLLVAALRIFFDICLL